MSFIPLELEFSLECLTRYLHHHPDSAQELALAYYEDFSLLAMEYKQLERDFRALESQLIQLQKNSTQLYTFSLSLLCAYQIARNVSFSVALFIIVATLFKDIYKSRYLDFFDS